LLLSFPQALILELGCRRKQIRNIPVLHRATAMTEEFHVADRGAVSGLVWESQ
jgi:hypothetical protein